MRFINIYTCDCGNSWEDISEHTCNDKCSECGKEISPTISKDYAPVMYCGECGSSDFNGDEETCPSCGSTEGMENKTSELRGCEL